ncbi:MAG: hypothetical protein M1835_002265, partial [Candelina submexicana]
MGIIASREFVNEINSCVDKGVGLESLLSNPEVTTCNLPFIIWRSLTIIQVTSRWQDSYRQEPPEIQKSIQAITSPPKVDCLLRIRRLQKSDTGISKKLRPYFESWRHPKKFFEHNVSMVGDAVSQVYLELRRISERQVHDPIRARIYAVALYDLRLLVDENESLKLRPEVREKIEQVILNSPLVTDSLEDVSRWTQLFLKFGERMKMIAAANGGHGALFVIPSSLLTVRQWAQRLNNVEFEYAVRHLQSIGVGEVANEAGAHVIANRIHRLILQKFTSDGIVDPDADQEEAMVEEEENEASTEDEEMVEADDNSTNSIATTPCSSLCHSGQWFHQGQRHLCQVNTEATHRMMTDGSVHHHHSAPSFIDGQLNAMGDVSPMDLLSEAVDLAFHENGRQNEERNLVSTGHTLQGRPSAPFPGNTTGSEQLRNFGMDSKELNQTTTNTTHDPSAPVTIPNGASVSLTGYNFWDYYPTHATQDNLTGYNFWDYYPANATPNSPTGYNFWDHYPVVDAFPDNPLG